MQPGTRSATNVPKIQQDNFSFKITEMQGFTLGVHQRKVISWGIGRVGPNIVLKIFFQDRVVHIPSINGLLKTFSKTVFFVSNSLVKPNQKKFLSDFAPKIRGEIIEATSIGVLSASKHAGIKLILFYNKIQKID